MATEKFHYEFPGGAKIAIAKFDQVPAGVARKTRKLSVVDQIFTAIEAVADEKTIDTLDKQTQASINDFLKAWQGDSGITMGESEASSTS